MKRILEPEVMRGVSAAAYADAPLDEVNEAFCSGLLAAFPEIADGASCAMIDVGCGPGDIDVWLGQHGRGIKLIALDASEDMLDVARQRIARANLAGRVTPLLGRVPDAQLEPRSFDFVVSNTFLHHVPEPRDFWRWATLLLKPGGGIYVRDLRRPPSVEAVDALVGRYAPSDDEVHRDDYRNSFLAALTLDEVRADLDEVGLGSLALQEFRDRYWLVSGRVA